MFFYFKFSIVVQDLEKGKNVFRRRKAEKAQAPAWFGYLANYQTKLQSVADRLSKICWEKVMCVYCPEGKCAVFKTAADQVLARVQVYGECGSAYKMIIRSDLDGDSKKIISQGIALSQVEYQPLQPYMKT